MAARRTSVAIDAAAPTPRTSTLARRVSLGPRSGVQTPRAAPSKIALANQRAAQAALGAARYATPAAPPAAPPPSGRRATTVLSVPRAALLRADFLEAGGVQRKSKLRAAAEPEAPKVEVDAAEVRARQLMRHLELGLAGERAAQGTAAEAEAAALRRDVLARAEQQAQRAQRRAPRAGGRFAAHSCARPGDGQRNSRRSP